MALRSCLLKTMMRLNYVDFVDSDDEGLLEEYTEPG